MKIILGNPALAMVAILYGFMPYLALFVVYLTGGIMNWNHVPGGFIFVLAILGAIWILDKINSK